eukprot:jgi/Picre1/31598/NNA_006950.t1
MSTEQKQEKTLVPPGTGEAMVTDNAEEKQADMPPSAEDDSKKAENPKGGEGQAETVVEKSKDAGEAKKKDEGDKAAPVKEEPTEEDLKTMPVRKYLETTVVGVVMQGMQQLVRRRPDDPVEWLADFLQRNNPKKRKMEEEPQTEKPPSDAVAPAAAAVKAD